MALILPFRATESRRRAAEPPSGAGAEILFFTGVRYTRNDDPPGPGRPTAGGLGATAAKTPPRRSRRRAG
ncbi:hypothetical protein NK718_04690 [Alsobacter sp. SYSU M60028]|uniref:Uncharacterized protein n=1 Tax=Alsobacter ponti TaxID=2962936 RepID=A0ABT1L8H5_9HYPH|nr:hypothetical protein [Alsobacter ponti]MCP8937802.1 hypothetical protein [Alsobacter ponti]